MTNLGLKINVSRADLIIPRTALTGALYLGSVKALTPELLQKHKISAVISMTKVPTILNVLHYKYPIPDHSSSNPQMQQMIPFITSNIHRLRTQGHNVLVHCYAGIHRAPTIVAHYLQRYEGHTVNSAVKKIRAARYIAFVDGNTFDLKLKG